MQTNDHAKLARYLIKNSNSYGLHRHKFAFFIGCIEPDCNLFTYVRGSIHYKKLRGHNAENVKKHISKCLKELQKSKFESSFSYFVLGTLIHYTADSFTFPHNVAFEGGLKQHIAYEKSLNMMFLQTLENPNTTIEKMMYQNIQDYFDYHHQQYCIAKPSMQTDCHCILMVCANLLDQLLGHTYIFEKPMAKKEDIHENSYHYRLV